MVGTKIIMLAASTALVGCVTSGKPEYEKARVVERINDRDETPEWAVGETAVTEEDGNVTFVNFITMAGNSRPEACMKAAELDAKSQMLRHIKENVVSSGQVNEASAADDPAFESLTAFFASGKIYGSKIAARYWERVEESSEGGERVLRLKCAAKVAVKKSELARQMREAIAGAPKGNQKVREALEKSTVDFINGLGADTNAR